MSEPQDKQEPRTWNEAVHMLRAGSQPEDFGHSNCPTCEDARAKLRERLLGERDA